MEFFKVVYPFVKKYSIVFSRQDIFSLLLRLNEHPTKEEAVRIGNIENVDGFVKQKNMRKYIAKLDIATIKSNPHIEIYWEKGIIKRPDIALQVKLFVIIKELLTKILRKVRR